MNKCDCLLVISQDQKRFLGNHDIVWENNEIYPSSFWQLSTESSLSLIPGRTIFFLQDFPPMQAWQQQWAHKSQPKFWSSYNNQSVTNHCSNFLLRQLAATRVGYSEQCLTCLNHLIQPTEAEQPHQQIISAWLPQKSGT